jgi:hypothetical protein
MLIAVGYNELTATGKKIAGQTVMTCSICTFPRNGFNYRVKLLTNLFLIKVIHGQKNLLLIGRQ